MRITFHCFNFSLKLWYRVILNFDKLKLPQIIYKVIAYFLSRILYVILLNYKILSFLETNCVKEVFYQTTYCLKNYKQWKQKSINTIDIAVYCILYKGKVFVLERKKENSNTFILKHHWNLCHLVDVCNCFDWV